MDVPLNSKVAPGNTLRLLLVDEGRIAEAKFQLTLVGEHGHREPPADIDAATANALLLMSQLLGQADVSRVP